MHLIIFPCLVISLSSMYLTNKQRRPHARAHIRTLSLWQSPTLRLSPTQPLILHSNTHTHSLSLSHSLTHTHTLSPPHPSTTHAHIHSLSQSLRNLGFIFDPPKRHYGQYDRVKIAMLKFREIHGHLKIPAKFTVHLFSIKMCYYERYKYQ